MTALESTMADTRCPPKIHTRHVILAEHAFDGVLHVLRAAVRVPETLTEKPALRASEQQLNAMKI